jgi:hypothetical protein
VGRVDARPVTRNRRNAVPRAPENAPTRRRSRARLLHCRRPGTLRQTAAPRGHGPRAGARLRLISASTRTTAAEWGSPGLGRRRRWSYSDATAPARSVCTCAMSRRSNSREGASGRRPSAGFVRQGAVARRRGLSPAVGRRTRGDWTAVGMTAAVRAAQFRRGEFATGDGRYTADQGSAGGA